MNYKMYKFLQIAAEIQANPYIFWQYTELTNTINPNPHGMWARYMPHSHDSSAGDFLGKLAQCVSGNFLFEGLIDYSHCQGPWEHSKTYFIGQTFYEVLGRFVLPIHSKTCFKNFQTYSKFPWQTTLLYQFQLS
jgi:hypothetical protein